MKRCPEFCGLFDHNTLLPRVAANVEVDNILDINLTDGYVILDYALYIDVSVCTCLGVFWCGYVWSKQCCA